MTFTTNSYCFICGSDNPLGLQARFEEQTDGSFLARFTGRDQHQGYPGRMHGGIIAALLAEVAARAAEAKGGQVQELRVRYRRPVPLECELAAVGRLSAAGEHEIEAAAELLLADGSVAAEARVHCPMSGAGPADRSAHDRPPALPVARKQPNSRMCFVCGTSNPVGLKARFYEQEDGGVLARFTGADHHVDHAGHLNIAAIAAAMDEAMGRAIMIPYGEAIWGVTAELSFRFLRPAPVGVELIGTGRITGEKSRIFEGSGRLFLPDGTVAVEGHGRYVKLDMVTLGGFDPVREEWGVRPD